MTYHDEQELNAWLAEHAMQWKRVKELSLITEGTFFFNGGDVLIHYHQNQIQAFKPATDPAAALALLAKCAEKTEHADCCYFGKCGDEWLVGHEPSKIEASAPALPLAISKFAKVLHERK